jgi:hypothetical protein
VHPAAERAASPAAYSPDTGSPLADSTRTLFATLAVIELAEAHRTDQLQTALGHRDVIDQAKGILMERYRLTADAAFAHLTRASQDMSMKLPAVALHLIETGELLGGSGPGR